MGCLINQQLIFKWLIINPSGKSSHRSKNQEIKTVIIIKIKAWKSPQKKKNDNNNKHTN